MARPLRVNIEGGWYHAYARGLNRMGIYSDDRERAHFLELLGAMHERYGVELHAYVLMSKHYHLVVRTPEGNLSRAMQWLNQSHAAWFNARQGRKGTVFQRPFGSVAVENGAWAYELSLYVHLNPLRIKALGLGRSERKASGLGAGHAPSREQTARRLKHLREYRWSSYRAYAGYGRCPGWLETREVLSRAPRRAGGAVQAYREEVQWLVRGNEREGVRERLLDSLAIGSAEFAGRVRAVGLAAGLGRETKGKRELRRRVSLEEVKAAVSEARGERWEELCHRRGDPSAAMAQWLARRYTGATLGEIGTSMGGRDYAAVGMAIRRFTERLAKERKLRQQVRCITRQLNVEMSPL